MALEEFIVFVRVCRSMLRERLDITAGAGSDVETQYAAGFVAGVLPACGMSFGMNAQVPGTPTVTSSPISAISSMSRCKWKTLSVPAGRVSSIENHDALTGSRLHIGAVLFSSDALRFIVPILSDRLLS